MPVRRCGDWPNRRTPVDHILCGFVCEKGSGGAYVWRYAFPLFDHVDFIHLGFGERLPQPYGWMPLEHVEGSSDAPAFLSRIEPYEAATYAWGDLENFLSFAQSLLHLGNPWIRRGYAMTLLVLGRASEAKSQLKSLLTMSGTEHIPHFREDLSQISTELSHGIEQAQRQLLTWEVQTKTRLGISPS